MTPQLEMPSRTAAIELLDTVLRSIPLTTDLVAVHQACSLLAAEQNAAELLKSMAAAAAKKARVDAEAAQHANAEENVKAEARKAKADANSERNANSARNAKSQAKAEVDAETTSLPFEIVVPIAWFDFRDVRSLAVTCTSACLAVRSGPLKLHTDVRRCITEDNLARLLHALQSIGRGVRALRLDQQPRSLWADRWREREREFTQHFPIIHSSILRRIARTCPKIEELALHNWHAYNGCEKEWPVASVEALQSMPKLRRVHLPSNANIHPIDPECSLVPVLTSCGDLLQIGIPIHRVRRGVALPTLDVIGDDRTLAFRLLQLSCEALDASHLCLLRHCPSLRRLELRCCEIDEHVGEHLPGSLIVLRAAECNFARQRVLLTPKHDKLQCLEVSDDVLTGACLRTACQLRSLRVLRIAYEAEDVDRSEPAIHELCVDRFKDSHLKQLIANCSLLHTLLLDFTDVSASPFCGLALLLDPAALPQLKVLGYRNEHFAEGLDDYFSMSVEELESELESELEQLCMNDDRPSPPSDLALEEVLHDDTPWGTPWGTPWYLRIQDTREYRDTEAFFAFAKVVVSRGLATPLQSQDHDVLPWEQHRLVRDYFEVMGDGEDDI